MTQSLKRCTRTSSVQRRTSTISNNCDFKEHPSENVGRLSMWGLFDFRCH